MRVITGTAKGRKLETVENLDVRPTSVKVKKAIFSAINFELEGAAVLDLFCGSGQMGIEALSRNARTCVFVDHAKNSLEITQKNLASTGLFKQARVVAMDYKSFLQSTTDVFDIAFLDPPYSKGLIQETLPLLVLKMSEAGLILVEHEKSDELPEVVGDFYRVKQYHYGRISVSAYRCNQGVSS